MTPAEYLETFHGIKPLCGVDIGPGWFPLVRSLVVALEKRSGWRPEDVGQIKQKFAELRFYASAEIEGWEWIGIAEFLSKTTCETCGMEGRQRGRGWYYVGCDACEAPGA